MKKPTKTRVDDLNAHRRAKRAEDKQRAELLGDIRPDHVYRFSEHFRLFGLRESAVRAAIKAGVIPTPIALSAGGKAKGWLGRQILEHRARQLRQAGAVR